MASADEELEKIVKILKSLIVPVKGGLAIHLLEREYKLNEGKPIPLAKYGFANIHALVRSIPEIHVSANGMLTVQSATLAHLTDLVARQKSSKPKGKKMRMPNSRPTFGTRSYSGFGARRPAPSQRSYGAPPVQKSYGAPIVQRNYGAPTGQRSYGAPASQRSSAPTANQQSYGPLFQRAVNPSATKPVPEKDSGKKIPAVTYKTGQPRPLPTVTYPGKKPESTSTRTGSSDSACNVSLHPKSPLKQNNEERGHGDGSTHIYPPVPEPLGPQRSSRPIRGRGGGGSSPPQSFKPPYQYDVPEPASLSDQLSVQFAEMQLRKVQLELVPATLPPAAVSRLAPPTPLNARPSSDVHPEESDAQANQRHFMEAVRKRPGSSLSDRLSRENKPTLAAWDSVGSSYLLEPALTQPYVPLSAQAYQAVPTVAQPYLQTPSPVQAPDSPFSLSLATSSSRETQRATTSTGQATVASRLDVTQRGPIKPLKPMDRLLRQNLDNDEAARARQMLEMEVEQERRRECGALSAEAESRAPSVAAAVSPPYPASVAAPARVAVPPPAPVPVQRPLPINAVCDWERQSLLMMLKPLFHNAQLIGDNLMMQVAKEGLELERHFESASGVPYRLGLCVSGMTLSEAAVEIGRQRAVSPTVVVCLGTIDILLDRSLPDMCRHMLMLLGALTQNALLIQQVLICTLPPLPLASYSQRSTLIKFNQWLTNYCSDSRIFTGCDMFECFINDNSQIRTQLYAPPVKINMGSEGFIELQLWNKLGCRVFLDAVLETLKRIKNDKRELPHAYY